MRRFRVKAAMAPITADDRAEKTKLHGGSNEHWLESEAPVRIPLKSTAMMTPRLSLHVLEWRFIECYFESRCSNQIEAVRFKINGARNPSSVLFASADFQGLSTRGLPMTDPQRRVNW